VIYQNLKAQAAIHFSVVLVMITFRNVFVLVTLIQMNK
jgi:hypothetical protein